MNLNQFHQNEKEVSTKLMFTGEGKVISLHIKSGGLLKEHITPVPALLIAISGSALFENELGFKQEISSGDYIEIEANVKHWVKGTTECELILIK
jgi:quercetin dioxygenase-like cupin family protein